MANICDERIVLVADTDADMAEALEKMCRNVIVGPNGENYFSNGDVDAASGDADKLHALIRRTVNSMNMLCLFSPDRPDSGTESGWTNWKLDYKANHPIFIVEIGVKWGPSYDPGKFYTSLDPKRFALSVSDGGEAYEWEMLSIDGDYFDASEIAEKCQEAQKKLPRAKSLQKIAYYTNLAGVSIEFYDDDDDQW